MTDTRWLDAREASLWQSYRDAYRELMRALEARLIGNAGLSGADYALLHPLSVAEHGVLRTRDLGRSVEDQLTVLLDRILTNIPADPCAASDCDE